MPFHDYTLSAYLLFSAAIGSFFSIHRSLARIFAFLAISDYLHT